MSKLLRRLAYVIRQKRFEAELAEEIDLHLQMKEGEIDTQSPPAVRARHQSFGNVTLAREESRAVWIPLWFDQLRQDVWYALRTIRRNPGFAATVMVTLALGIGANTAIFTVINGILLRPLPYHYPEQLVQVLQYMPSGTVANAAPLRVPAVNNADFDTLRTASRTLQSATGSVFATATLVTPDDAVRLEGSQITSSVFSLLGVQPALGRPYTSAEESAGADTVVVLSHDTWRRHFAADPAVIGRVVRMDDRERAVVAVMPDGFSFPDRHTQFWIPYVAPAPNSRLFISPAVVARLAGGASIQQAQAELDVLFNQAPESRRYEVAGLHDELVAPVRPALQMIAVAVAFVLLIATVNVANLTLARAEARQRELAVRAAIGASRGRLLRQAMTESVLLSVLGGAVGVVVAAGGVRLLQAIGANLARRDLGVGVSIPRLDEVSIDPIILGFSLVLALTTGLLCGLAPALRVFRTSPPGLLRARGLTWRAHRVLVVTEVALAMMLLVGGGLVLHSFVRLAAVDPGYDPSNVLTFQVNPSVPLAQRRAFADDVTQRFSSLPGVRAAAYGNNIPLVQQGLSRTVSARPLVPGERLQGPFPGLHTVSPDFVATFAMRVVEGRDFGPQPGREALVNRALVRSGFLGDGAIGRRIYSSADRWWEVVGVVEDVRHWGLDQAPGPEIYIVEFIGPPPGMGGVYFALRSELDPLALARSVQQVVRQQDPLATIDNIATMDQIVSNSLSRPRLYAVLLSIFGICAAALAAIGIYGVLAYSVTRRTHEIGVRAALGATRGAILRLVLRQGLAMTLVGLILGLAGAVALTQSLQGLLFGISPLDPVTFLGVTGFFVAVAFMASMIPAYRATQVDPIVALRYE